MLKRKRAEALPQPAILLVEPQVRLEGIPDAKLHDARRSLNAGKPHPVHWNVVQFESRWIEPDSESGTAASVRRVHALCVGDIERFHSELQLLVFTPG